MNCVVRDLSDTGAKLGVSRHAQLPSQFILCFVQRKLSIQVRLRWRRGDFAGVSFESVQGLAPSSSGNRYVLDA